MTTTAPPCGKCGGRFACTNCERTLRTQLAAMRDEDHLMMSAGGFSGVHPFFDEAKVQALYATSFPIGPRRGAMIDLGNAVVVESWLPYREPSGLVLPFVPMPFTGREIVHDIGRKQTVERWELEACERRQCRCASRPTGWLITRPIVRALLAVTDHALNDWGRVLPGALPVWGLAWDTLTFMRHCYFNPQFVLPKRDESREARAARARSRSSVGWKHPHRERACRRR